jgi:hypothetical protein
MNIGGIVGRYFSGSFSPKAENCTARGDIRCEGTGTSRAVLGGVAGYIYGNGDTYRVTLKDCTYRDGKISRVVDSSSVEASYAGGLVGMLGRYGTVENCASLAASVSVYYKTPTMDYQHVAYIYIGGFAGRISEANIKDCYSTSPVSVPIEHQGTNATIYIGGFAGQLISMYDTASSLERCYATGPVTSYGHGYQFTGGLVGASVIDVNGGDYPTNSITRCYATGSVSAFNDNELMFTEGDFFTGGLVGMAEGTNISECYATGAVSAQEIGRMAVVAGGLVGILGQVGEDNRTFPNWSVAQRKSSITNSYALGNVFAATPNGSNVAVYAGGLVGRAYIESGGDNPDAGKIAYNFAAGSVTAQSVSTGVEVYAGGVVGYKYSGELTNNAALGDSVTAKGGNSRTAARVYAYPTSGGGSYNYAVDAMRIEKSSVYGTYYFPYWDGTIPEPALPYYTVSNSTTATAQNGASAAASAFRNSAFWTASSALGFSTGQWNFGGVVSRGYPALADVVNAGGQ